jgi:hypothetical protein
MRDATFVVGRFMKQYTDTVNLKFQIAACSPDGIATIASEQAAVLLNAGAEQHSSELNLASRRASTGHRSVRESV